MIILESNRESVKEAVKAIKRGQAVVFPTDTVYGLLADAVNKKAVDKIFKIKKRKKSKPFPVFVKNLEMAEKFAEISEKQAKFLKKVWPGKVTAVLKRKRGNRTQKIYGAGKTTIALRIPKYKLISELLENIKNPLIGTSANVSGFPASTQIKEVIKQFQNQKLRPDFIIDAGYLPKSKPSKIIDLTGKKLKILRK